MPELSPIFRRRLLLAGLASAASLAAGCSQSAKPPTQTLSKDATLLCLGDSLTFGFGASPGNGYPQQLEKITGQVTQNAGVNGDTSAGALARLPALLEENKPGLVLIGIGGNDFLRRVPLESTRNNLRQIVLAVRAHTQVVLIAEPLPDALAAAASSLKDHPLYAELAAELKVPLFADGWSYVLSRANLRSDQIHANDEGYKVFAEKLAAWLKDVSLIA